MLNGQADPHCSVSIAWRDQSIDSYRFHASCICAFYEYDASIPRYVGNAFCKGDHKRTLSIPQIMSL